MPIPTAPAHLHPQIIRRLTVWRVTFPHGTAISTFAPTSIARKEKPPDA